MLQGFRERRVLRTGHLGLNAKKNEPKSDQNNDLVKVDSDLKKRTKICILFNILNIVFVQLWEITAQL